MSGAAAPRMFLELGETRPLSPKPPLPSSLCVPVGYSVTSHGVQSSSAEWGRCRLENRLGGFEPGAVSRCWGISVSDAQGPIEGRMRGGLLDPSLTLRSYHGGRWGGAFL